MANKGESKQQKRLSVSRAIKTPRKKLTWILRADPGQHKRDESVPLGIVLRDMIGIAGNLREAKIILLKKGVLVNGIARKSQKFAVGLFDVIDVPLQKKAFRIVLDNRGRFELQEIAEKEKNIKLCKIVGKKTVKKGIVAIETNDGRTISSKKSSLKPDDSILISIPEQKIQKEIVLGKGKLVYIVGGEHAGEIAKVKEVIAGTMKRPKLVSLEEKEHSFQTTAGNVFVVGESKPEIKLKVSQDE
jgi:small subunit ribosomal protein S4e